MVRLLREQKTRAIGVSNFDIDDLSQLMQRSDGLLAVDQVEFHPFLDQERLLRFCEKKRIQMEAYSPLTRGMRISHPTIVAVANKYRKTPAQVLIRWNLQHGLVVIPKSVHEERILENSKVFDFELEPEDMEHLNSLNENLRTIFLSQLNIKVFFLTIATTVTGRGIRKPLKQKHGLRKGRHKSKQYNNK